MSKAKCQDYTQVARGIEAALVGLGVDLEDPNFNETPRRVAGYLLDHFLPQDLISSTLEGYRDSVFPSEYRGMVILKSVEVHGLCPHHLLPVHYSITVAYLPQGKVIGLSKLARIAECLGGRAALQEDITLGIGQALREILSTDSVAVEVSGEHSCMAVRGVMQHGHQTLTSEVSGAFMHDPATRSEFLSLARR